MNRPEGYPSERDVESAATVCACIVLAAVLVLVAVLCR
jgi:hypothetical protein